MNSSRASAFESLADTVAGLGAGFAVAGDGEGLTLLALDDRLCTAGPDGILTLPPAPTVAHPSLWLLAWDAAAEPAIAGDAVPLLARSAYLFPMADAGGVLACAAAAAAAASLAFCLRASSSRWISASVFLEPPDPEPAAPAPPFAAAGCFHGLPPDAPTGDPVPHVLVGGRPEFAAAAAALSRSRSAAASCSKAALLAAAAASSFLAAFFASASWISFRLGPF